MPFAMTRQPYAWAGSIGDFACAEARMMQADLVRHHEGLNAEAPPSSQLTACTDSLAILRQACAQVDCHESTSLVLEFEVPFEGGRRPDAVALLGSAIAVLEFKGSPIVARAHTDQAAAYRRDLVEYHEASRGIPVHALIVTSADADRD